MRKDKQLKKRIFVPLIPDKSWNKKGGKKPKWSLDKRPSIRISLFDLLQVFLRSGFVVFIFNFSEQKNILKKLRGFFIEIALCMKHSDGRGAPENCSAKILKKTWTHILFFLKAPIKFNWQKNEIIKIKSQIRYEEKKHSLHCFQK